MQTMILQEIYFNFKFIVLHDKYELEDFISCKVKCHNYVI